MTKQSLKVAKNLRSAKKHGKNALSKIPQVYFTSQQAILRSFDWIPPKAFEDIDLFLIACDDEGPQNEYKSSDYVSALLKNGITRDKIFIVPPVVYRAEIPVIDDGKLSPQCKNMNEVKPLLRYMEYHVTDFCNLKCKGCTHLSNYVKELEFAGTESFRMSLIKLAEKFRNISTLRLLGGEPLLCRDLHEYIYIAHEVFPYSHIKVVTNGLLVRNMTRETIDAIKDTGAEIQVTQYPPTRKIAGDIVDFCHKNGMKLCMYPLLSKFYGFSFSCSNPDSEKCWLACRSNRYCHFLNGTVFYPCPMLWTYDNPKFRDIVGERVLTDIEHSEYSYDLAQDISDDGWDILAKFENPMEVCRKCGDTQTYFEWESEIPEYNK